jgi:hypothetical protein
VCSAWPPKGIALWGQSATKQGVLGQSVSHYGVEGTSSNVGVKAECKVAGGIGILAKCPLPTPQNVFGSWAGLFQGNVAIIGDLTKTGIGSSVAVRFPDRSYRQLYSIESPESWFEDFGEGRLVKGKAEVKVDPDFAKTVNLKKRYYVFVTPHSTKISGLAVVARLPRRFRVEHPDGGNGTFSYRIVAKRADINVPRLKGMKLPDLDLITKEGPKGARGQARTTPKRSAKRRLGA